jgi:hypothetical protein
LNDGTEISGFLFGDKISVPEIWEFLGETWKMNRVPYAPTKIKLEQTY